MGTITLLLGGARSGKSRLAEQAAERHDGPLLYCATAEAGDDEMAARIAHHRARRGPRWQTLACPIALPEALHAARGGAVLVDCLTLWLTNILLAGHDLAAAEAALLAALGAAEPPVYLVSNEVGLGIVPAHRLGRDFRDAAGRLNQAVAARADRAFLVVAGRLLRLDPATAL
ncbi:bifunctional adenosylcobinamide kinase/adenosylcobinamide-phosphate guanylyltransferase [Sphingomonas morindae]|uniref:Bifunctional adenosylcobalamin biosynthesis protein n=1 Tax=Sphingomonas morindae TaxID=1541170 RepID=A0ABY4XC25_9SPHN|nr:bifunctional adenosylcobinamide kinase/adenosylcobinamide-phosphate guanylyltransferase [Sphingomonas morindae]USI74517.1 bifunctional adenosylcobinamide kinase/adenosylcobinamide-phosphate guanylyltransferase [Sphingomonas morindae]